MKTPFDNFETPKVYEICVTLNDTQKNERGNYVISYKGADSKLDTFEMPFKSAIFMAVDFKAMKEFINSLVEIQIEKLEIKYE